ncbi:mechanosensitive ion channel family protein [Clostridium sp. MSJ-11]|uniref:Mechanosensitive ion channel family protein n=1 Tax=Clostridium mobile TaxID=2841512 RepID=A0ABS6EN60_9CLOT|nr:mechanosensitive ion channel domain-containing protein [Clostridium mobile]MBU5485830.1 mechanosensitive ion channel family protein [Clostridium mobile]
MGDIFEALSRHFNGDTASQKFLTSLMLFIILHLINKSIAKYIDKANFSSMKTIKLKKSVSIFTKIIFAILIVPIWWYESKDILTFLGLFSAGMAYALKDLVSNFLGWVMINSHKPFVVGDRIKIGESLGDVLEMNWFHTTIIEVTQNNDKTYGQSTGRLTYIPNSKFIFGEVVNETGTFPYTWNEIQISLKNNSDWKKAKDVLMDVASKELGNIEEEAKEYLDIAAKTHPIYYQNLSHIVYTSMGEGKIILTLRFICRSRNYRNLEHSITEAILSEFEKYNNIYLL